MKKTTIIAIISCALVFISCSSNDDPQEIPSTTEVTYSKNIKTIMDDSCMACHIDPPVNGAPINLVSFQSVKNAVENSNLIGRVENGSMPPGNNNLSAAQIQAIKDWKEGGYKE